MTDELLLISPTAPKRLFTQQLPAPSLKPSRSFTSFAPPPTTRKPVAAPPTARKAGPGPARDFATPYITKTAPAQTPAPPPVQLSATPLPSASRRRRSRHSNTPGSDGLGTSTRGLGPGFVTPPRQMHTDGSFEMGDESFEGANVSGGSLGVGSAGLVEVAEEEESDGEVEYMPPKVVREYHLPLGRSTAERHLPQPCPNSSSTTRSRPRRSSASVRRSAA